MPTSNWTSTKTASFNIIKDGKPVDAKTVNHALDHIRDNLQYLYDKVEILESDSSAVVAYGGLVAGSASVSDTLPGTPVYWADDGWAPARIDTQDGASTFHWDFEESSLAQGLVIRTYPSTETVDVCLSGKVVLDLITDGSEWYVVSAGEEDHTTGNALTDLFEEAASHDPTSFAYGVQYLSETTGKLTSDSVYPRSMAVMVVEDPTGDAPKLNMLVCPEGFGGERAHTHSRIALNTVIADGGSINYDAIPYTWHPDITISGKRLLNTALAEIDTGSRVYEYTELLGTPAGSTRSDYATLLYTNGTGNSAGWLSAKEFTGAPPEAIWGFTVERVTSLATQSAAGETTWNKPVAPDHIILVMDGVPVPNSHYKIDDAGIWWTALGVEHAPLSFLFNNSLDDPNPVLLGPLELIFIDPIGDVADRAVTAVTSDELIPSTSDGVSDIQTKDSYLSQTLAPVLPFNPMDDVQRASEAEVEEGTNNKIITPATAKYAIDHFVSLTQLDEQRSCKEYQGDWENLTVSGFYQVTGATDGPRDSEESSPLGLVGTAGTQIFQFELGEFASFVRVGKGGVGTTVWGAWLLITEKPYDPLYLPRSTAANTLVDTTINLRDHRERTIVSLDESTNKVIIPELTGDGAEDGMGVRFINEMTPGSEASTLVIELTNQVSGSGCRFLVCPGQDCEAARHHMGQVSYMATGDDEVSGIPEYLDVQVTAKLGDTITVNDTNSTSGELRYVKFECEAPQYYGNNSIELEVINGAWSIVGGSGIWFMVNEAGYADYVTSGDYIGDALEYFLEGRTDSSNNIKIQDNSRTALKFTTRQVRVSVVNYATPVWGRLNFSSSGGIQ